MPSVLESQTNVLNAKERAALRAKGAILVIEDDKGVATLISEVLRGEGFQIQVADTVFIGRNAMKDLNPILIILDRKLPDADGLELCAEIRRIPAWRRIPILFLTALSSAADKVAGLTTGADDYLGKPFSCAELLARVLALLRRCGELSQPNTLEAGELRLDMDGRKALLNGSEIHLWQKEFDLLACLITHKNRVLTRNFLLQQVWDYAEDSQPSTKVVDVMVSHLRNKLGPVGDKIVSVRGMGYRMDLP